MKTFDSIIFDMDGTLWDAVDSYCTIWDKTLNEFNCDRRISRTELLGCMGKPIKEIFINLNINISDIDKFLNRLDFNENEMMPKLGGILYENVKSGVAKLSQYYKLFMVSNCGANGLKNFLKYTQLNEYFTDSISYGQTQKQKDENIKLLISKYDLSTPVYVGDTQSDCDNAHKAGIKMIFAKYGFGQCNNADYEINSFSELTKLLNCSN